MADLYEALVDLVDELTRDSRHRTPRHTWSPDRRNRNKIQLPDHVTRVPALLTQLAARAFPLAVGDDDAPGARQVPSSREPGSPAALAAHLDIAAAVARWADHVGSTRGGTLASRVRGLLGVALALDEAVQRDLFVAMSGWVGRCETVLGLREQEPVLPVPCPDLLCRARTLHADLERHTVRCTTCGARWAVKATDTVGSLALLGEYVAAYRTAARTAADLARAEARRRRAEAHQWRSDHGDDW